MSGPDKDGRGHFNPSPELVQRTEEVAAKLAALAPHQQRVVAEAGAREGELAKLEAFIGSPVFQQLDRDERILLTRQATIMEELVQCLHERIGLWMEVES